MTTKMREALINEIAFIFDTIEHEDINSLNTINTMDEAQAQCEGYIASWSDELPEGLSDPATMMMVWNYCIEEVRKAKIEATDDLIAEHNPDDLRFRKAYKDGSSAFFGLDQLDYDLVRAGYDTEHREIIMQALKTACANQ